MADNNVHNPENVASNLTIAYYSGQGHPTGSSTQAMASLAMGNPKKEDILETYYYFLRELTKSESSE